MALGTFGKLLCEQGLLSRTPNLLNLALQGFCYYLIEIVLESHCATLLGRCSWCWTLQAGSRTLVDACRAVWVAGIEPETSVCVLDVAPCSPSGYHPEPALSRLLAVNSTPLAKPTKQLIQ